jgi:hypothetical protein
MDGNAVLDGRVCDVLVRTGWMLLFVSISPKGCLSTRSLSSLDIVMAMGEAKSSCRTCS